MPAASQASRSVAKALACRRNMLREYWSNSTTAASASRGVARKHSAERLRHCSHNGRNRVRIVVPEDEFTLACDAQTSGGLLIAVSSANEPALVARFLEGGLFYAKVGSITDERGVVSLVP